MFPSRTNETASYVRMQVTNLFKTTSIQKQSKVKTLQLYIGYLKNSTYAHSCRFYKFNVAVQLKLQ